MKSSIFSLNTKDFLRGLILAGLVPALVIIQQSLDAGVLTFNWKSISMAAIAGFVGYLLKNFLTDGIKQSQATLVDAKTAEIKKTEPNANLAAIKIDVAKNNLDAAINTTPSTDKGLSVSNFFR